MLSRRIWKPSGASISSWASTSPSLVVILVISLIFLFWRRSVFFTEIFLFFFHLQCILKFGGEHPRGWWFFKQEIFAKAWLIPHSILKCCYPFSIIANDVGEYGLEPFIWMNGATRPCFGSLSIGRYLKLHEHYIVLHEKRGKLVEVINGVSLQQRESTESRSCQMFDKKLILPHVLFSTAKVSSSYHDTESRHVSSGFVFHHMMRF